MTTPEVNPQTDDSEISLPDIINFLKDAWKKLAISAVVGTVLGLSGWFVLGNYSAEFLLLNNNNSHALDLVSWKMLQKSLPNLADRIVSEQKVPEGQASIYKAMSGYQWWQKNVIPSFAISKADTKDLAGVSKDLDGASTTILNFTLTASGASKDLAVQNVRAASQFLRSGAAYLQLRALLNGYESQTISTVADLRQKITSTQAEMKYQEERVKNLEELRKRFPNPAASSLVNQQIDVGNNNGKYLPLTAQIIAANTDINQSKEVIARAQDRLNQIALVKVFLEQALPLQYQAFDGLELAKKLLEIDSSLRAKLDKTDSNGVQFLNQLDAQLLEIQVRFTKGLEANTAPTSTGKKGMLKAAAGGCVAAFFLMLIALVGQRVWQQVITQKEGAQ